MEKRIENYLYLYKGCNVFLCKNLEGNNVIEPLTSKMLFEDIEMFTDPDDPKPWKLLLRRLVDMTREEKTEIGKRFGWYEGKKIFNEHHLEIAHDTTQEMVYDALITADENDADRLGPTAYFEIVPYLLKQGLDLFGLLDAGLALDAIKFYL